MSAEPLPNATPSIPPLSCEEALRQIECLVEEGSLKNTERALLMAHLDGCSTCHGNLERRRQLDAHLREAFAGLDTRPDFTERLLALIPKREGRISSAWRRTSVRVNATRSASPDGTHAGGSAVLTGRTWKLSLVAAALLVVVGVWWFLHAPAAVVHSPVRVADASNILLRRDTKELVLTKDMALGVGDELTVRPQSETDKGSFDLSTEGQAFCSIHLAAGARLVVHAPGRYELQQGEAYFDVNPNRPGKDRSFNVETFCGKVQVVGTAFGIIVPSAQALTVTVVVDRGTVRLKPLSGLPQEISEGQECNLLKDGGTSAQQPILANRMPLLRSLDLVVENATSHHRPLPHPDPAVAVVPLPGHVDWNRTVADLDFTGKNLSEALLDLQQRTGPADEWPLLAAQAAKLAPAGTSSLLVRRPIRAGAVVRWLAREQGLRFSAPSTLRLVAETEPLGEAQDGELPATLAAHLDSEADLPEGECDGEQALRLLAERSGFAVLVDPHASLPRIPRRTTWRGVLEQFACSSDTDWAWYDGILYLAPRRRIEALTMVARSEPLSDWLGPRPLPAWERSLKQLLSALSVDREGHLTLNAEWPILSAVALYPDERGVQYTTGVRGVRTVAAFRALLQEGSASVADPVAVLNELEANGPYRELGDLVALAARRANVIYEGEPREFPMHSFSVRRMPLGRALERAAWLHGLGLRLEPGRIVVGGYTTCYGGPVLNEVLLTAAAKRCPRVALQLPETLARQAQACYPERLRGVTWLPLRDALVFCGDRNQLAAVQAIAREMEQAISAAPDTFDPQAWQPLWRLEVEQDLAKPFRGDESGQLPAGSFVGLLRQSGLFIPLKTEILVDPTAMKELASRQLSALNVRGLTMGQTLNTLAGAVGLRVVLEDGVIWLRP